MGLFLHTNDNKELGVGYITYLNIRRSILYSYDKRLYDLFEADLKNSMFGNNELDITDDWNKICNEDLDLLIWHSDCDGKLSSKECKKIYKVLENLNFKMPDNLENLRIQDAYYKLKEIIRHCGSSRHTLYFD